MNRFPAGNFARLVLLAWGLACAAGAAGQEIVLGQSADLSGPTAAPVKERILGAQAYFDLLNARGGVHGRKVVVRTLDDAAKPDLTAENTRALAADSKILALFNYAGTAGTEKAMPLLAQAKLALVAPFTGAVSLRERGSPNVFHVRGGYDREVRAAIRQALTVGLRGIAVFHSEDALGRDVARELDKALREAGVTPLAVEALAANQPMEAAVKRLAAAAPQIVICGALSGVTAKLVKAMRETGYQGQFVTLSNASSQSFVKALGGAAHGVQVTQVMPHPSNQRVAAVREFRGALRGSPALLDSYAALEGFISAKVVAEALRRAGPGPTRDKVLKALAESGEFDAGGFHVGYAGGERRGSGFVEVTMIDRRGRFVR